MAKLTPFAGLYQLEPNDPISLGDYEFYRNDEVIDNYINAFVTHRHNGLGAVQAFTDFPSAVVASAGGSLDPGETWYIGVTAVDQYAGETIVKYTSAATVGTSTNPTVAPVCAQAAGGTLNSGTYRYVYTYIIGSGETTPSPNTNVVVGFNGKVTVTRPVSPSYDWRVYRAFGFGPYHKVADIVAASTSYVDDGTACVGCDQEPPEENTTNAAGKITITRGSLPASATGWRVYISSDPDFVSPSQWRYASGGSATIASGTSSIIFSSEEEIFEGSPPPVNRTIPGASLLFSEDIFYDGYAPWLPSGTVNSALDNIASSWVARVSPTFASASAFLATGPVLSLYSSAGMNTAMDATSAGIVFAAGRMRFQDGFAAPSGAPAYTNARDYSIEVGPGLTFASAGLASSLVNNHYEIKLLKQSKYRTVTTTTTLNHLLDEMVVASGIFANIVVNLPSPGFGPFYDGTTFNVKKMPSAGIVTVTALGGFQIEAGGGAPPYPNTRVMVDHEALDFVWYAPASTWIVR